MSYLVCDMQFEDNNKWNFELKSPYFYFESHPDKQAFVIDYDYQCRRDIQRFKLYDLELNKYIECNADIIVTLLNKKELLGIERDKREGFKYIKIPLIPYEAYLLTTLISYKYDRLHLSGVTITSPIRSEFNIRVLPKIISDNFDFLTKVDYYTYAECDTWLYLGTYLWYCYRFVNEGAYYSLVEEDIVGKKIIVKLFMRNKFNLQCNQEITYTIDKIEEWKRLRTKIKISRR